MSCGTRASPLPAYHCMLWPAGFIWPAPTRELSAKRWRRWRNSDCVRSPPAIALAGAQLRHWPIPLAIRCWRRWRWANATPSERPLIQAVQGLLLELFQAGGKIDPRAPAKQRGGAGNIGQRDFGISRAPRYVHLIGRNHIGQLLDRDVDAAADIEGDAVDCALVCRQVSGGDIAHVDKVAPLLAATVDFKSLPVAPAAEKNAQHQGVSAALRLARAVNVKITQDHDGQLEDAIEELTVFFADVLAERIEIQELRPHVLAMGAGLIAVVGRRPAVDEAFDSGVTGRQQHILRTGDVLPGAGIDRFQRGRRARHRGRVKHPVNAIAGALADLRIGDIAEDEIHWRRQPVAPAKGKIVQHAHLEAARA